jgi:hypothetical protein
LTLPDAISLPPSQALRGMIDTTRSMNRLQYQAHCRLYYTKLCLIFGWHEEKVETNDGSREQTYFIYKNYNTGAESRTPPIYTSIDHYCAGKIQSIWAVFKAKKFIKTLLVQDTLVNVAYSAIVRYQQIAFIGYGMEGCLQFSSRVS